MEALVAAEALTFVSKLRILRTRSETSILSKTSPDYHLAAGPIFEAQRAESFSFAAVESWRPVLAQPVSSEKIATTGNKQKSFMGSSPLFP